jgi:hypothetical protein
LAEEDRQIGIAPVLGGPGFDLRPQTPIASPYS